MEKKNLLIARYISPEGSEAYGSGFKTPGRIFGAIVSGPSWSEEPGWVSALLIILPSGSNCCSASRDQACEDRIVTAVTLPFTLKLVSVCEQTCLRRRNFDSRSRIAGTGNVLYIAYLHGLN